jgi:hypothetical protein
MPKALLCALHDKNFQKRSGLLYKWTTLYDLGNGVRVKLAKETHALTKYAGIGLKAATDIPKDFCLGFFKKNKMSPTYVEGFYNVKMGTKYFIAHEHSLLNKINTIPYLEPRKNLCNCEIYFRKGKVAVKTKRNIKRNEMLWADYGNVRSHYWKIQYAICKSRLQQQKQRKGAANLHNEDNDFNCRTCKKRHVELVLCDTCRTAVCDKCMSNKEKYLLCSDHFFCKDCLDHPSAYPNRFAKKILHKENKYSMWLNHCNSKYCTALGSTYDLPSDWKRNLTKVKDLFQKAKLTNVEFLNFKGGLANDKTPWDVEIVKAMINMLDRTKTRTYGINLGEIYFTKQALIYFHDHLQKTWIGFLFIEPNYNSFINDPPLKGCFRYTSTVDKRCYPYGSNLQQNRKQKPAWYKNGNIAPWYDKSNKAFLKRDAAFNKCFWSPIYSKHFTS